MFDQLNMNIWNERTSSCMGTRTFLNVGMTMHAYNHDCSVWSKLARVHHTLIYNSVRIISDTSHVKSNSNNTCYIQAFTRMWCNNSGYTPGCSLWTWYTPYPVDMKLLVVLDPVPGVVVLYWQRIVTYLLLLPFEGNSYL